MQIVPAQPGWEVVWAYGPEDVKDEKYYTQPVACWVLVELENRRLLTALIAGGDDSELILAYDSINFLGYAHPGLLSSDPYWKEEANLSRGKMNKMRAGENQSKEMSESD